MAEKNHMACYDCGVNFSKGPPSFVSRTSWAILVTLASTKMIRKSWPWSTRHEADRRDRLWDPWHGKGGRTFAKLGGQLGGGSLPPVFGKVGVGLGLVEFKDVSVVFSRNQVGEAFREGDWSRILCWFSSATSYKKMDALFGVVFVYRKSRLYAAVIVSAFQLATAIGYGSLFERRRRGIRYLRNMGFRWLRCESEQFRKVIKGHLVQPWEILPKSWW